MAIYCTQILFQIFRNPIRPCHAPGNSCLISRSNSGPSTNSGGLRTLPAGGPPLPLLGLPSGGHIRTYTGTEPAGPLARALPGASAPADTYTHMWPGPVLGPVLMARHPPPCPRHGPLSNSWPSRLFSFVFCLPPPPVCLPQSPLTRPRGPPPGSPFLNFPQGVYDSVYRR